MIHFNKEIEKLNREYQSKDVILEYLKLDQFHANASITIKTQHYIETINVLFTQSDLPFYLDSSAINFTSREHKTLDDVLLAIEDRVNYAISITGTKKELLSDDELLRIKKIFDLDIQILHGASIINYADFRILCNLEKLVAYITIGFKTIEIPLSKVRETLDMLSDFKAIN